MTRDERAFVRELLERARNAMEIHILSMQKEKLLLISSIDVFKSLLSRMGAPETPEERLRSEAILASGESQIFKFDRMLDTANEMVASMEAEALNLPDEAGAAEFLRSLRRRWESTMMDRGGGVEN